MNVFLHPLEGKSLVQQTDIRCPTNRAIVRRAGRCLRVRLKRRAGHPTQGSQLRWSEPEGKVQNGIRSYAVVHRDIDHFVSTFLDQARWATIVGFVSFHKPAAEDPDLQGHCG
jgi:hypothetical protein